MEPLKIGITGVRGVVGETLTPELVVRFAEAFGAYLDGGRVLVCRDPRPSGPMVQAAVTAGLLSVGCEVVDLGICPTPSLQLAVPWLGATGGHLDHRRPQPAGVERAEVRARRRPLPQRRPGRGAPRRLPPGRGRAGELGPARDHASRSRTRSPTTSRSSSRGLRRSTRIRDAATAGGGGLRERLLRAPRARGGSPPSAARCSRSTTTRRSRSPDCPSPRSPPPPRPGRWCARAGPTSASSSTPTASG